GGSPRTITSDRPAYAVNRAPSWRPASTRLGKRMAYLRLSPAAAQPQSPFCVPRIRHKRLLLDLTARILLKNFCVTPLSGFRSLASPDTAPHQQRIIDTSVSGSWPEDAWSALRSARRQPPRYQGPGRFLERSAVMGAGQLGVR